MKKAYILIHGNLSNLPHLQDMIMPSDMVICADGAAEFAFEQNILPDVIIGDLDSISSNVQEYFEKEDTQWKKFPREKDATDAELAIRYALDSDVDELIILGLLGDRVDHMLSNIFHISEIAQDKQCSIIEGNACMYFVKDHIIINGKKGDELSLIPLKGRCGRISTRGLYYPLQQEYLEFGSTRGISNVFSESTIEVRVDQGTLLVIHRHF